MMRRVAGSTAFRVGVPMLLVLLVGVLVLVDRGSKGREDQPVRFGVLADQPIGDLPARREACQNPIDLDRSISSVGLGMDSAAEGGPPLRVTVRDSVSGKVLRSARVPAGYKIPLKGFLTVPLDGPVPSDRAVSVCAQNLGKRPLTLVGKESVLGSDARVGTKLLDGDWGIFFPNPDAKPRNYLQMAPDMLDRATVLRPGIVTPLFYVLLALIAFVGGPVLLWRAVLSAAREDDGAVAVGPSPAPGARPADTPAADRDRPADEDAAPPAGPVAPDADPSPGPGAQADADPPPADGAPAEEHPPSDGGASPDDGPPSGDRPTA